MSLFEEKINPKTGRVEYKPNEEYIKPQKEWDDYTEHEYTQAETDILFADDYMAKRGFAKRINGTWYYAQERYRLLHYLIKYAHGSKHKKGGRELAMFMFRVENTEKLRQMINDLRNDLEVDLIIGSDSGGYYIARKGEELKALGYIKGKSINEMITVIRNIPYLAMTYIKIASLTMKQADRGVDEQLRAVIDEDLNALIEELEVTYRTSTSFEKDAWRTYSLEKEK